jgi:hypothetical protein
MVTGCLLPKSDLIFIVVTEEGSAAGDDSDDGNFEPSLNFTLRFVMLISYVSVVTYILEIFF